MKKRGLDRGLIVSFATLALLFSLGILFFVLFVFDIDISKNLVEIVGSFSGLSGGMWLFLLCRNC